MKKKLLCLLLAAAMLLLSACSRNAASDPDSLIPESTKGKDVTRARAADNYFSLNYNVPRRTRPL